MKSVTILAVCVIIFSIFVLSFILIKTQDKISDVDYPIENSGSLSGIVYQLDGKTPEPDAEVVIFEKFPASLEHASNILNNNSVTRTNSDGFYSFAGLKESTYEIRAKSKDTDFSTRKRVKIKNAVNSQMDLALSPRHALIGHIYQSKTKKPAEYVRVELFNTSEEVLKPFYDNAVTDADGSFVIPDLTPGEYCMICWGQDHIEARWHILYDRPFKTSQYINILDTPTTEIRLEMPVGGSLSGRIYDAITGKPIVNASVEVHGTSCWPSVTTDAGGCFVVFLPVDKKRDVTIIAYKDGYIPRYYNNVYADAVATRVSVDINGNIPCIDIGLEPGAIVSGHVYGSDVGLPTTKIYVFCSPKDRNTLAIPYRIWSNDRSPSSHYLYAIAGSDGSYKIDRLFKGEYYLFTMVINLGLETEKVYRELEKIYEEKPYNGRLIHVEKGQSLENQDFFIE